MQPDNNRQVQQLQHLPSIHLLPQASQPDPPENDSVRRDKRLVPSSVNNFIQKTYAILQQKQFESIVSWSGNPDQAEKCQAPGSFKIYNLRAFEEIVLPRYFKHSNMSSFVRQLNMYNFHKVRSDRNEIEFEHDKFLRNRPDLLVQIKRKQVQSTNQLPSIALIPLPQSLALISHPPSLGLLPQPSVDIFKENAQPISLKYIQREHSQDHCDSPDKRDQSEKKGGDQRMQQIAQIQQTNRLLKKQRQVKAAQLKQMGAENRSQICDKFNKFIFSLIAGKLQQDVDKQQPEAKVDGKQTQNLQKIHDIIDHIMDSSQSRPFKQYLGLSRQLLGLKGVDI